MTAKNNISANAVKEIVAAAIAHAKPKMSGTAYPVYLDRIIEIARGECDNGNYPTVTDAFRVIDPIADSIVDAIEAHIRYTE